MTRRLKTPLAPCIYCGSDSPPRNKREHVMSRAMGSFEHNWTLDCVCDDCNAYFSRELELPLGRDSIEALLRIVAGVKSPSSAENFIGRHMKFSVAGTDHFDGMSARMVPSPDGDGLVPDIVPQVALSSGDGEWTYLREHALTSEAVQPWRRADRVEIKIIGQRHDTERLREKLAALGIRFTPVVHLRDQTPGDGGAFSILQEFAVTTIHRRAAAKIVFNYAAKMMGDATVRLSAFDHVRTFVRHGGEPLPIVVVREQGNLVGVDAHTTAAHSCGIEWVEQQQRLVGLVCLFNRVRYGVRLCDSKQDEWVGLKSHHVFDPVSHVIINVTPR
jgi:hypothetical protein